MTRVLMPARQAFHPLSSVPSARLPLWLFFYSMCCLLFSRTIVHILNFFHLPFLLPFMFIHDYFFILFHLISSELFIVPCGYFPLCLFHFFAFILLLVENASYLSLLLPPWALPSWRVRTSSDKKGWIKILVENVSTILNGWKYSQCGVSGENMREIKLSLWLLFMASLSDPRQGIHTTDSTPWPTVLWKIMVIFTGELLAG